MTTSAHSAPLLLLHGFCHGSWCWSEVIAHVLAAGRRAVAVDMAGHGLYARRPHSFTHRPHDPEAFRTEVSPMADMSFEQAAELLTSQIKLVGGGSAVTVVAHSAAGVLLTRVAQQSPELVSHAVYLAAVMPASDEPPGTHTQWPEFADSRSTHLFVGDPAQIGALRLDVASNDDAYRTELREAFYNDTDPVLADTAIGLLTPDAPLGLTLGITTLTHDGWGSVPRTYITCARDNIMPPATQARFIAEADAAFPENLTTVAALDASHSPFLSIPGEVAGILTSLGRV
jgi:pimeloyl-ACP methyl ester carboxylesterase